MSPQPRTALGAVRTPTAAQRRSDAAAAAGASPGSPLAPAFPTRSQASVHRSPSSSKLPHASSNSAAAAASSSPAVAAKAASPPRRSARKPSQISEDDDGAAGADAAPASSSVDGHASYSPRHHTSSHHRAGAGAGVGALLMRQSPPSIQPPLVDPALTPLIVLANLGGSVLATLDVGHKHIRDRVPLPGLASVVPNNKGSVVTASEAGWAVFNPSAHLSEDEKLRRRQEASMESPGSFSSHGGAGKAVAGVGGGSSGASKNKYDEEGRLVEDAFDAARVFSLMHAASKNNTAAVASAAPASSTAAVPAASATTAAAATALAPPSLLPSAAAALLTSAFFLPDGRLLTADRAGMLRLYADEAHRFRLLCEQPCGNHDSATNQRQSSSGSTPPSSSPGSNAASSILTGLGPRAIVACLPLEDGRLLTAQDAEVCLWDEVPQEAFLNAPVFRVDRSFTYTASEAVNMPGVLAAPTVAAAALAANAGAASERGGASGAGSTVSGGGGGSSIGSGSQKRAPIRCALVLPHARGTARGLLLTGHDDRSIQVLDLHSFTLRTSLYGHFNAVTCLIELNDLRIASGSTDSNIKIWSGIDAGAATGSKCDLTLRGHSGPILSLCPTWHPHQLISTSTDGTLRVWNTQTGTCELVWTLGVGAEVSSLSLLPVSAASREVEMAESDAEMQAIAEIISAEGSAYTMPQLPPGAFAHLGLKQHEAMSESERTRRRAALAAAVGNAEKERQQPEGSSPSRLPVSTRTARRPSLTLSPNSSAYSSLGSSVFASQPTPPAVAGLSQRMSARDALIRQHAAPAAQLVALPLVDENPSAESQEAEAPWLVSFPAAAPHTDCHDPKNSAVSVPPRSKPGSPSPHQVVWAAEVTNADAANDGHTDEMPPTSAGTSRSVSPQRARVFDRSSAVERAAASDRAVGSLSDRSAVAEREDSPSRATRIPPALLAASHVDFSALSIPVPGDAVRQGPLPKAAPLITELSSFSPDALTHIIWEQHRREHLQRVTINKRVSSLLEPRRIFKRYGAVIEENDRKAERIVNDHVYANRGALNTISASAAIAAALASGMATHEEEKQQGASHMSLARQIAQARLAKSHSAGGALSDELLYKGGADSSGVSIPRSNKTSSFLPPHVQAAWELKEAMPKPGANDSPEEKREKRHVVAQMVARIGSPPRRSKEAEKVHQRTLRNRNRGRTAAAASVTEDLAAPTTHVIHSPPPPRGHSSPGRAAGRDRSPKPLQRASNGTPFESTFFVTQITEEDRKQIAEGGAMRKSQSHAALARSPFAPPPAAGSAAAVGGRLGLGSSASASTLGSLKPAHSSSERCYVLGGVKLAEPPAQFNRALYGHLLYASPNPRGGLQFNHRAHYGRLEVYEHRDKKIRVARHGVKGAPPTRMARTQDLPQPSNSEFLARMAYDEQIRMKGLSSQHSPGQSPPQSPPPSSPGLRSRPLTGHSAQPEFDREKVAATAAAAAAATKEALMQRVRTKAERRQHAATAKHDQGD